MAFDYNALGSTVSDLLVEFGTQNITQIRDESSDWERYVDVTDNTLKWENKVTGDIIETAPVDRPTTVQASGVQTQWTKDNMKGFLVETGDKLLLIKEISPPQTGDIFEVNGTKYAYVNHIPVNPADTTLLYKVQVRV